MISIAASSQGTRSKGALNLISTAACSQGIGGLLASFVGEGHHLDHHMKPRRERRPGLDVPWYITVPLWRAVGLVAPAATAVAAGDIMAPPPVKAGLAACSAKETVAPFEGDLLVEAVPMMDG